MFKLLQICFRNPNGQNKEIWKPVSTSKLEYLHINNLTLIMKDNYFLGEEYEFWKSIGSPTLCSEISSNPKN